MIKRFKILKYCILTVVFLILINIPAHSQITDTASSTTVTDYEGTSANFLRSDWMNVDARTPSQGYTYEVGDSSTVLYSDYFEDFSYKPSTAPILLTWTGTQSFVSVYNENSIHFSVQYQDSYNNNPSTGYPKVKYWPFKSSNSTTLSLSSTTTHWLYTLNVTLPRGSYYYYYIVKNDAYPLEYDLATGSFTVCSRPCNIVNTGVNKGAVVTSSKIVLSWAAVNPEQGGTTYKLYVGKDSKHLLLVYTGSNTSYALNSVDGSSKYYWQVEVIDVFGVSDYSEVYDFQTLGTVTKAFNYPNPFNPASNQLTNIVFDMQDQGSAEITVYTEFGHPVWRKTFDNLNKGSNEVQYNGRDDDGRELFNGTYVCLIKRKYGYGENTDKCRLLIIK